MTLFNGQPADAGGTAPLVKWLRHHIDPDSVVAWLCWAAIIGMLIGVST